MDQETFALTDINFIEALREFSRWQSSSQLIERDGILFVAGTTSFPMLMNYAVRIDPRVPAPKVVSQAKAFFDELGRDFTIFTRGPGDNDLERAATSAGMQQVLEAPWMILDEQVAEPEIPPNIGIRQVVDEQGVLDVCHINSDAYESLEIPKFVTEAIFGVPSRLLSPNWIAHVAYLDEEPVATAMTLLTQQVAGIYWVGTKKRARGLGLAEVCTRVASNVGFLKGSSCAVLQASPMGESIYRRIGYTTVSQMKCYLSETLT